MYLRALSPLSPPPHHTPAMGPPHGGNIPAHLVPAMPAHSLSMVFCETPGNAGLNHPFLCHRSYSATQAILMRIKCTYILSHIQNKVIAYKIAAQRTLMILHDFMFSQLVCLSVAIFIFSLHITTNNDRHSRFHMTSSFHSLQGGSKRTGPNSRRRHFSIFNRKSMQHWVNKCIACLDDLVTSETFVFFFKFSFESFLEEAYICCVHLETDHRYFNVVSSFQ